MTSHNYTPCIMQIEILLRPQTHAITKVLVPFTLEHDIIIVIRYKVYNEEHPRAGLNIQHVIYEQLARAGQNS